MYVKIRRNPQLRILPLTLILSQLFFGYCNTRLSGRISVHLPDVRNTTAQSQFVYSIFYRQQALISVWILSNMLLKNSGILVYLSVCLYLFIYICLSIYLSVYLYIYLTMHLCIYLSICLSVYLSIYLETSTMQYIFGVSTQKIQKNFQRIKFLWSPVLLCYTFSPLIKSIRLEL